MAELLERKHCAVHSLAVALAVSEATVRRDLRALAGEGRAVLVHGGAVLPRDVDFSFQAKQQRNLEAKKIVAELAAGLIADGDHIFLDSGTTCFEMAAALRRRRAVTVLINSARLAPELHGAELSVILLGGQYRPARMDVVGPLATRAIEQLRGYIAFIGADGLSLEGGPAAVDIESADLYRRVVEHARQTVLAVDHAKFERAALYRIVEWEQIDRVVSDRTPRPEWREFFRERGIEGVYPRGGEHQEEPSCPRPR